MAGTDRRQKLIMDGPVIILVNPQLGENIGASARAMANFGLAELRLVDPRDGWPNEVARANAAKADHIIDGVQVFDTLEEALADLNFVYATTARQREMLKPVRDPATACATLRQRHGHGERVGILFGRERWGLESVEVALADEIVTFPVNPAFASLNISQAVLLMSYEWMRTGDAELPISEPPSLPARKEDLFGLFDHLEGVLDRENYFRPPHKRATMVENLRNIFQKAELSQQEIHALRGVVATLEGRKTRPRKDRQPPKNDPTPKAAKAAKAAKAPKS
ncbi:MAG: RNA methyltransferase [Rhizobiaceae bacterium]|nr:RNA methyltransferase [Hyphomicrobiales bacterium]NRB31133.1 RNA methyltransferase [Rhizobiaceae bacterium]